MHWNHRVVKTVDTFGEDYYEVCEVYYNEKDEPCGYCDAHVGGDNLEEIKVQIERFTRALEHPILNADEIKGEFHDDTEEDL